MKELTEDSPPNVSLSGGTDVQLDTQVNAQGIEFPQPFFLRLIKNLPIGVFHLDKNNTFDFENDLVALILGCQLRPCLDPIQAVNHCIHPADKKHIITKISNAIANIRPLRVRCRAALQHNQTDRWIQIRSTPEFDEQQVYQGSYGTIEDITETIHADATLSTRRLQNLIDQMSDGIITCDEAGIIKTVNSAFTQLSGYKLAELLGRSLDELGPKEYQGTLKPFLEQYPDQGLEKVARELSLLTRDGTTIPIELTIAPTFSFESTEFVACVKDLRERKLQDLKVLQSQKMDTMAQLAAGSVHDFNNLLAIIQGNMELLGDHVSDDNYNLIELAQNAVNKGAALAQRLLDFTHQSEQDQNITNVYTVIDNVSHLIRSTLGNKIKFRISCDSSIEYVRADPDKLSNALLNLAINARDAMPQGGILKLNVEQVGLEANTNLLAKGNYYCISMSDTGVGMGPALLARVCDPFFSTKLAGKGTGLGLTTASSFANQANGMLEIDSTEGVGTTVSIWLPKHEAPIDSSSRQFIANLHDLPRGTGTILLVEDNDALRANTKLTLQVSGYDVLEAADSKQALSFIADNEHIDLLLADIILPYDVDGFEIAHIAQARFPDIQIIIISGYNKEQLDVAYFDQITSFLQKPFSRLMLTKLVSELLTQDLEE